MKSYTLWILISVNILTSLILVLIFSASIITGPQIAHYLNLVMILFTLTLLFFLIKKRYKKGLLFALIGVNLIIEMMLVNYKYGYINWYYINPVTIGIH